jgi:hypothetical protein
MKKKKDKRPQGFIGVSHEIADLIKSMAKAEDRKIRSVAERLIRKGLELEGVAHR